jgi:tetratricopeptide (TPR) repeat protein
MHDAADAALRRAERFSRSSLAWNQAGFAFLASGRPKEARQPFENALAIDADLRGAQVGLARTLFEVGEADRAATILREVLARHPEDADAAVSLAVVLAHLGRTREAIGMLESHSGPALRSASFFAIRGNLHLAVGESTKAVSDLRKAVRLKPDWVHARNALGVADWKVGNRRAAEQHFREALRVAPLYEESFLNLLRVMIAARRFEEVLDFVMRQFQPTTASAMVGRIAGVAAFELQRWPTAISWWQCAAEKTEDGAAKARIFNEIGCAYSRRGDQSAAGRYFELSIAEAPTELAIVNRAKAYALEHAHLLAVAWLQTAPVPDGAESIGRRKLLAQLLAASKQTESAIGICDQLMEADDADKDVYALLSALLADHMGDAGRAIQIAGRGLARFPGDPTITNNLAYSLLMAGDVARAAAVLSHYDNLGGVESMFLTATRGLLALRQGHFVEGRRLYEEALSAAGTERMRERVRAKRDLEIARAILAVGGSREEAAKLLKRASGAGLGAAPYPEHATKELQRLRAGPGEHE